MIKKLLVTRSICTYYSDNLAVALKRY